MTNRSITLSCALLAAALTLRAQKVPMDVPVFWKEVRYDINEHMFLDESGGKRPDYEAFKSGKTAKEAWRVFTDKENIPVYDEPGGKEIEKIAAMSTRLYVYKEKLFGLLFPKGRKVKQ